MHVDVQTPFNHASFAAFYFRSFVGNNSVRSDRFWGDINSPVEAMRQWAVSESEPACWASRRRRTRVDHPRIDAGGAGPPVAVGRLKAQTPRPTPLTHCRGVDWLSWTGWDTRPDPWIGFRMTGQDSVLAFCLSVYVGTEMCSSGCIFFCSIYNAAP